jgi:hypothetical protein
MSIQQQTAAHTTHVPVTTDTQTARLADDD